jgi:hypothetical protein
MKTTRLSLCLERNSLIINLWIDITVLETHQSGERKSPCIAQFGRNC